MGVDQGDRHGSGAVTGQDFHQFTGVEQVLHVVARDLHQPQPGAAAGDIAFGVVDHHPAGQFEPLRMAVVGGYSRGFAAGFGRGVADAPVSLDEIAGLARVAEFAR